MESGEKVELSEERDQTPIPTQTLLIIPMRTVAEEEEEEEQRNKGRKNKHRVKKRSLDPEENPNSIYYLPRIPRRDIRRQYAMMFSNVYNSQDWDFMSKFIDTFFLKDTTILLQKYLAGKQTNTVQYKGSDNMLHVWYDAIRDVPDIVFDLDKTQIKVRSDGTAVISSTFHLTGTVVHASNLSPKSAIFTEIHQQLDADLHGSIKGMSLGSIQGDELLSIESSLTEPNSGDDSSSVTSFLEEMPCSMVSYSDFDKEFEAALEEYLNEEDGHNINLNSTNDHVEVQRWNPPSPDQRINSTERFDCSGYFALHLDAESRIHYATYSIFNSQS